MPIDINKDAVKVVTEIVKKLIVLNKIEDALNLLEDKFSHISDSMEATILLNKANFNSLKDQEIDGLITSSDATVEKNKIKQILLSIMKKIPEEIEIQQTLGNLKEGIYKISSDENLERILGSENHLVKINWLQKAIQASKSVCQVLRADGAKGTGFILKDGYLMTNFHVLPDSIEAASAKIIFDYEEDLFGNMRKTSEFFLDADDSKFSPVDEFDFAYIKIKDNLANPLSQWNFLELDTFSIPQINNPVTIIQHPLGQSKQIALTANRIIGINGQKLLYETDTERGSSGSPVFNNDWKVIALHHAGMTAEDGGLVINPETGEKRGANEGILIKKIAEKIGLN